MGSSGAAMRALAGSPEPRREDQAAPHRPQDPHHRHPTGRERQASQVGTRRESWVLNRACGTGQIGTTQVLLTSHSLVGYSLQSVSHQLTRSKSSPLMIFNHTVTCCTAATTTFPFSSDQRKDRSSCGGDCLDKYNQCLTECLCTTSKFFFRYNKVSQSRQQYFSSHLLLVSA